MSKPHIEGFEILEKAGEGGMAVVWKARQISLDRIVAVKVLNTRLAHRAAEVERFQTEARAAARLKHPGIVQVHDAACAGGLYYFVMEYVAGYTVGEWVRRKGVLEEKNVLLLADCVADALQYAWKEARIIHCDIKPDNVMIDDDGTVKVADLGLARTISAMSAVDEDEVMGTPSYTAPEQALGETDLDHRTDIYALGATLYHLLTGKLMFEGEPEERIMEMQVNGTVAHPYDINPGLSRGVCRLMERMLAKDRDNRQATWAAVRADIARVRRGLMPEHLPPGAAGTLRRQTRQHTDWQQAGRRARPDRPARKGGLPRAAVAALVALAALAAGLLVLAAVRHGRNKASDKRGARPPAPVLIAPGAVPREALAPPSAPAPPPGAEGVRERPAAPPAPQAAAAKIMEELRRQAESCADKGDLTSAAAVYEAYRGPLADQTADQRIAAAGAMRARAHEAARQAEAARAARQAKADEAVAGAAKALAAQGPAEAAAVTAAALADPELAEHREMLSGANALLRGVERIDERIAASFAAQKGQTITLQLASRAVAGKVVATDAAGVTLEVRMSAGATARQTFAWTELSAQERLARIGPDDDPAAALVKGLMAMRAKAYGSAARYFGAVDSPLGGALAEIVSGEEELLARAESRDALLRVLAAAGIAAPPGEPREWGEALRRAEIPDERLQAVQTAIENYYARYGETDTAAAAAPALRALQAAIGAAEARRAAAAVRLSPELEAARGKPDLVRDILLRRNPDLAEGEVRDSRDAEGRVVALEIRSSAATDLSAVAALTELKAFACGLPDAQPPGQLKDIAPLKGLRLERCAVVNCRVTDISPLRYMPLKELRLTQTAVRDIAALAGMELELLDLRGTRVLSFTMLRALPLRTLDLSATALPNISFMREMALNSLAIADTRVADLRPLTGVPLGRLDISRTRVTEIGPLAGMPVVSLTLRDMAIANLKPLHDMKRLRDLDMSGFKGDFSALKGLPLTSLRLDQTRFSDVSVLEGMPLTRLSLRGCPVTDLSALRGMPLSGLDISNTTVSDLAPLEGAPLRNINCQGTRVEDLAPLKGAPIEYVYVDRPAAHAAVLRKMPNLKAINGKLLEQLIFE